MGGRALQGYRHNAGRSAQNVVHLLATPDARPFNGAVFFDPKRFQATPLAYDAALATQTWELSSELIEEPAR